MPLTVEKDWDFGEHPLIARLASDEERVWSLLRGATWWLPLTDSFLFQGPLPTDDQTMICLLYTSDVRDGLIHALLSAEYSSAASNLMSCLAMQGDDKAMETLLELERNPRPWRKGCLLYTAWFTVRPVRM